MSVSRRATRSRTLPPIVSSARWPRSFMVAVGNPEFVPFTAAGEVPQHALPISWPPVCTLKVAPGGLLAEGSFPDANGPLASGGAMRRS